MLFLEGIETFMFVAYDFYFELQNYFVGMDKKYFFYFHDSLGIAIINSKAIFSRAGHYGHWPLQRAFPLNLCIKGLTV
jgi:hypothetical protein